MRGRTSQGDILVLTTAVIVVFFFAGLVVIG